MHVLGGVYRVLLKPRLRILHNGKAQVYLDIPGMFIFNLYHRTERLSGGPSFIWDVVGADRMYVNPYTPK
jgi:hypothetical protein